jgi:methionyl-tRNA formyltransferase
VHVLYLGAIRPDLIAEIERLGDRVSYLIEPLTSENTMLREVEFMISYRYHHKIPADVLARLPRRAINLHISFLPWNRGADPNLWSFLENTPKGVTIHQMSDIIDHGGILCQREIVFQNEKTLRDTYDRLIREMDSLFIENWAQIKTGELQGKPQGPGGSSHRVRDRIQVEHLLAKGWETPVVDLVGKAPKT